VAREGGGTATQLVDADCQLIIFQRGVVCRRVLKKSSRAGQARSGEWQRSDATMRLCAPVIVKQEGQAKSSTPCLHHRCGEIADATTATSPGTLQRCRSRARQVRFATRSVDSSRRCVSSNGRPNPRMVETTHLFASPAMRTIDLVCGGDGGGAAAIE
jgi:hypothetical protein